MKNNCDSTSLRNVDGVSPDELFGANWGWGGSVFQIFLVAKLRIDLSKPSTFPLDDRFNSSKVLGSDIKYIEQALFRFNLSKVCVGTWVFSSYNPNEYGFYHKYENFGCVRFVDVCHVVLFENEGVSGVCR